MYGRRGGLAQQIQSSHPSFTGELVPSRFPDDVQLQFSNDRIAKGPQCLQFAQAFRDAVKRVDHPFATDRRRIRQTRKSCACWLHEINRIAFSRYDAGGGGGAAGGGGGGDWKYIAHWETSRAGCQAAMPAVQIIVSPLSSERAMASTICCELNGPNVWP